MHHSRHRESANRNGWWFQHCYSKHINTCFGLLQLFLLFIHHTYTSPPSISNLRTFNMDYVNKLTGSGEQQANQQSASSGQTKQESGGFLGGIGNKMNEAAGGGAAGEKNEDMLDKGNYS